MNYIGSKQKLSDFIKTTIYSVVGYDLSDKIFCDLFAGTGAISRAFKHEVKKIIANDFEYYSYVLIRNYIENHREIPHILTYIDELNRLPLIDTGFIFKQYSVNGGCGRLYFSEQNGKKIDTMRQKIEDWYIRQAISEDLYFFLLASLLESADKIANTASVYGAFLKKLKKTAQKALVLEPALFSINSNTHRAFNVDSNQLIKQNDIFGDILYVDPPYNTRQYGANYHVLNTIAQYHSFEPHGKTGLPVYKKSRYCSYTTVLHAFEDLLKHAHFKYIFVSYNNEGLMQAATVKKIMKKYGKYGCASKIYQRFKADKDENRFFESETTQEYVHILEKYG
ncbi:putative adenine-specific DNA-methyltransferase [Pillotina sp. SPG140]|jgi:adenine-specific DNA-methyltransferase